VSLIQEMSQRALDLGVPMSVHFDITYRCNERCVHCYLDHDDHGEMTTSEIKRVLDELADAGTFFLTFSGGEVLMRRDFFELLEYARNLMFAVRIKTNAVMIGESEARRMLELGVDQIQVSIYSHRPEVHDAITKLPGSLRRSIEAIRFLTEGNRVKAVVQFRGREIAHTDLGRKLLLRFATDLSQYGSMESQPRLEGRNAHVLISPVKVEKPHAPKEKEKEKHKPEGGPAGGNAAPPASA